MTGPLAETVMLDSEVSTATLVAKAAELVPELRKRAEAVDRNRSIPAESVEAIRRSGLFDVLKPRLYGGFEMGPQEHALITMEIARGCASTAWVYSLLSTDNLFVLAFSKQVQDEFWSNRSSALAGSIFLDRAKSSAQKAADGYRLSGTFGFCSGSDYANWLIFSAAVDGDDVPRIFLVPKDQCQVVDDWFTIGMRGTGSRTYVVNDIFVPKYRTIPASHIYTGGDHTDLHPSFDMLQCRNGLAGTYLLSSVAVGTALGAIEYFVENAAAQKRLTGVLTGTSAIADSESVLSRFSESAVEADLAKLRIEHGSAAASERVRNRQPALPADVLRDTRDQSYICMMMMRCIDRLHATLGAKACFEGHPIARAMRDVHTIATHVTLNWDRASSLYGKSVLSTPNRPA